MYTKKYIYIYISVCNKAVLWGKLILISLAWLPSGWALLPSMWAHRCAPDQSCQIHKLGPNEFISIDWFLSLNWNSVKSLKLLHVAFIFMFGVYFRYSVWMSFIIACVALNAWASCSVCYCPEMVHSYVACSRLSLCSLVHSTIYDSVELDTDQITSPPPPEREGHKSRLSQ